MKQLATEIDSLAGLQKIIGAYEEIAAGRMQNIRGGVLSNREFMMGLGEIFQIVKTTYKREALEHKKRSLQLKNGRTVRVFLSANTGLYGDIVQKTFNLFKKDFATLAGDSVVIGQLGKSLCQTAGLTGNLTFFDFPDMAISVEQIQKILEFVKPYETVVIYHGLFKNLLHQDPIAANISGDEMIPKPETVAKRRLIFEPTLFEVLNYFETEIFSSLLMQSIYESQLAKFSSRMVSLDQATENIKEAIKTATWAKEKERHRRLNRKQVNMLTGRQLWQKN